MNWQVHVALEFALFLHTNKIVSWTLITYLASSLHYPWGGRGFSRPQCASACIRVDGGSHCSEELSRQRRPRRRKHLAQLPPVYQGDCLQWHANRMTAPQNQETIYSKLYAILWFSTAELNYVKRIWVCIQIIIYRDLDFFYRWNHLKQDLYGQNWILF